MNWDTRCINGDMMYQWGYDVSTKGEYVLEMLMNVDEFMQMETRCMHIQRSMQSNGPIL